MLQIADIKPATEYIDGIPHQKVSPKRRHSAVQLALSIILNRCSGGNGQAGPEWRMHLTNDTTLVPDVAYASYERLRSVPDDEAEEPWFPPEIVVEVRSPSDRQSLIDRKIQRYLEHGTALVIEADPETRELKAHTHKGERIYRPGDRFCSEDFPWLDFKIGEAFAGIDIPKA